ncbi:MAG TPA: azurin [Xylella sp.]
MKRLLNTSLLALLLGTSPAILAKTCAVVITANDQMKFDQNTIKIAPECTQVNLTLKHTGKKTAHVMGHNWVLTKTTDMNNVALAGLRNTLEDSYLPKADPRIIAHTKIIGGGENTTITFPTSKLSKDVSYTFFCSFPGHWTLMKGTLSFVR